MKQEDVVVHWANQWRSLRAWRATIPMVITVEPYKRGYLGKAWSHRGDAKIRLTGKLHIDLATALHELAHLAAPNSEAHGMHWRELFVAATAEALDISPDEFEVEVSYNDLDRQVEDAVATWLARSGQTAVLRAIGVMP